MLNPEQLDIDQSPRQRRIFAFGRYPAAYLVIDLSASGRLMSYFCYEDVENKVVSCGGSTDLQLREGHWSHVALVCDRDARELKFYVDGYCERSIPIPSDFDGDFNLGETLTLGSQWHNYFGLMDEVKIDRRALSNEAIRSEFNTLKDRFGIVESPSIREAKLREDLAQSFDAVTEAWQQKDFSKVREICKNVLSAKQSPSHYRSYAHLRFAASLLEERNFDAAKRAYAEIASDDTYPKVHRDEAGAAVDQMDRLMKGLPMRSPTDSQTTVSEITSFDAEVFVATDGRDSNPGTREQPLATLTHARDVVRALKKQGVKGPIAVTMLPGQYRLTETISLTSEDSGTDESPIIYRSSDPGEAIVYGGESLSGFRLVTDKDILDRLPSEARGKVWECGLKSLGIEDYGELQMRGFGMPPSPPTLELYVNGVPMTLARWPNEGFVGIEKLVQAGSTKTNEPSVLQYLSNRHERWIHATDPWLFGYFHFLWADATIKVARIDTAAKTITTERPYSYAGNGMSAEQGIQYYAFNLLEEIDLPGEWYLERETGTLYLYPPTEVQSGNLSNATVELGMLSTPMLTMNSTSNVTIQGLTFDLARFDGVVAENCQACSLIGCTVSRMAGNGVLVHGGNQNRLIGCDIHTIGRRATEVIGGDRATLSAGNQLVENCCIHDFGRLDRTYTPAIQLEGVGNRVAHNLMYNGPSSAMRIEGNDHVIEMNEVHSMVLESDDQGAMELFANPSYRGVVFRHNYFHQIGKAGNEVQVHGQAAIRFDDAISGMLVYGNVFRQSAAGNFGAIQMNSGRDNIIDNNLFVDCKQGISGGWNANNSVWVSIRKGQPRSGIYTTPLYLEHYPLIATMMDDPGINHVWRNIFYDCGKITNRPGGLELFENYVYDKSVTDLVEVNNENLQLHINPEFLRRVGLQPIPIDQMGLYESAHRASRPVKTTPVEMPDWRIEHRGQVNHAR